ncbi:PREDICTED: MATH and LRR domain-containing protein PFE0570w-like isoform X2 [Polistes dominula]|uniref:MATH and LRR domain-containing protein PFE0570w-like isoform X2 n=1 Tax=Polistes dominula TaxID=743375 RepID=A0ABM1HX48_POLDO|nr:PREDICTED: MATH and LRR domain-containing protein PFE0570w-like isoform X2 [Polistes dominula]
MLCLKKRRTYSFTQGTCVDLPRRSKKDTARYEGSLNMAITTLPRKNRSNREERPSGMVLTVTEDTPADMLAGSMELLVQLPREHHLHTQRVTVQRSTPMMDLLVQIATAHKLAASNYTLQAIGERGLILPHQPNTPIGALDALQVKLLPKQCTFVPKKVKHANQPFETTFRLQVHLPRNQLYVSRVSPKMNLGEILNEVCREKNLDKHKYELRHPVNLEEILDLNLSLQDYHLQEVTLYAKQGRTLGSALSSQDIMALQRQEERRRQQAKQSVFGFMFKKSKESSVSTDSLEGRSVSPARSDETGRSASPLQQPPTRPQRKRRLAPKPPASSNHEPQQQQQQQQQQQASTTVNSKITTNTNTTAMATSTTTTRTTNVAESSKEKMLIGHSRNSSDSSGYHEASVLSDNPDIAGGRLPETLPRRSKAPGTNETPRKLVHTSQSSKSLGNLAVTASGTSLDRALSSSSLSSTGLKKKRAAPPPPVSRPLSSAISTQALERIDDSEESLTSDMDPSKPPSDIGVPSKASSDIGVSTIIIDKSDHSEIMKNDQNSINVIEDSVKVENARVDVKREMVSTEELAPLPKPRNVVKLEGKKSTPVDVPPIPKRRFVPPVVLPRSLSKDFVDSSSIISNTTNISENVYCSSSISSNSSSGGIEFEAKHSMEISLSRDDEINSTSLENDDKRTNLFTKHAKSMNDLYNVDNKSCKVISMIPKCNHLISSRKKSSSCSRLVEKNDEKTSEKDDNDFDDFSITKDDDNEEIFEDISKSSKRPKVYRSPSEVNDFQIDTLKKKRRHFTSQSNDFMFALNLNLMYKSDNEFDVEENNKGQMERANAVEGISDVDKKLCDTDVLLHKVSETLSSSSLTSTNEEETDNVYSMINKKKDKNCRKELHKDNEEIKNQQDTSDYVSALEEDSSIVDWEYQLPAPPSAFRDNDSQIFDGYDTVTLRSVDAFKETLVENENESINSNRISEVENKTLTIEKKQNQNKQMETTFKNKLDKKCNKNEIILELENKIEKGTLSRCHKEIDSKKIVNNNNNNLKLTSNVAPIDNTLSNFTITTYTRQKSIDIFKDEKDNNNSVGDETSRNRKIEPKICNNDVESKIGIVQRSKSHVSTISQNKLKSEIEDNKMMDTKIEKLDNAISEVNDSKQIDNTTLRTNNDKFSQWRDNMLKRQDEPTKEKQLQSLQVLKSILPQLTNSQPAEENVTKERNVGFKEKMKNRYETESNENSVTTSVFSTPSESHVTAQDDNKNNTIQKDTNTKRRYVYNGPPAISLGSWAERPSVKVQIKTDTDYKIANDKFNKNNTNNTIVPINNNKEQSKETNDKHERNDDLTKKFINHATVSGLRKLPSTNKIKHEEKPIVTSVELKKPMNLEQNVEIRHHKDNDKDNNKDNENLIDTTPLNFQQLTKTFRLDIDQRIKPSQRSIANRHSEYYGSQQELIRKSIETNKQNGHTKLDEFPILKKNVFKNHASSLINENHNPNFSTTEKKPFTTIVGINSYNHRQQEQSIQKNNNISLKNNVNNNIKIHAMSAPVVKGFKVSSTIPFTESKVINKVDKLNQNKDVVDGQEAPKAPTMPVIMGVTLKSANARPKSMPINVDSRDMLLESIRNFGGRGQLKNTAERY